MGACQAKPKQESEEVSGAAKLKVSIVGVRGHLEHTTEEEAEAEAEEKGRSCQVKNLWNGVEAELFKTKAVEGTCESVWKEETEFEFDMSGVLEFTVWEAGKSLGVAKLEGSAFAEGFNGEVQLEDTCDGVEAFIKLKIGVDETEYPSFAPEFTVSLTREKGASLGADVDSTDGVTVRVSTVDAGPVQTYNESEEAKDKVNPGDFIVKANKATGASTKIMKELKDAEALELTIKRSEEFSALLKRSDTRKPLGLEFLKNHDGNDLIVSKVAKGAVTEWNKSNADRKICKGDRIVAVCGKKGTDAELQQELSSAQEAKLTVVRPASPKSWQFV